MFGSLNSVTSASINAKIAGLTDQALKTDYLKNFSPSSMVNNSQNTKI
jgi:hypothetical protein